MPIQNLETIYRRYQGANVIVFGASGFIGRWVARAICQSGARLTLPVRNPVAAAQIFKQYGIHGQVVMLDLEGSGGEIGDLVHQIQPTIIFNLGGYGVDRNERDEATAYAINSGLVTTVCTALAEVPHKDWDGLQLVHAGSALEYGDIDGNLAEDSAPRPGTLYGRSKLAGTKALAEACRINGVRGATARLFSVYGPGENSDRLLPSLLRTAADQGVLRLTAGLQMRDFTYVEDVAEGLLRIGVSSCLPGSVLNLACGQLVSVREFAQTAAKLLSMNPGQLEFGAIPTRNEEMAHAPVSNRQLQQAIDWVPSLSVRAGIGKTIEFLQADMG